MNIQNLTSTQLNQAADLLERIEELQNQLAKIEGSGNELPVSIVKRGRKGGMSAAGRARIAEAQRKRWAKVHAAKGGKPAKKKIKFSAAGLARIRAAQKLRWAKVKGAKGARKRTMSAAARAAISKAAKARWAKAKAAGKTKL